MINGSATTPYISRRPAWAKEISIEGGSITYSWTCPIGAVAPEGDGESVPVNVVLDQEDELELAEDGVTTRRGELRVYFCDTHLDVDNARLLAQAILMACDRVASTLEVA